MSEHETAVETTEVNHWDTLKQSLQDFRERVGSPSYGDIAERVAAERIQRGINEYEAKVGKTTIYDAFKSGQRRVNLPLIREIGGVLGAGEEEVEGWIKACHKLDEPDLEEETPSRSLQWTVGILVGALLLNQFGIWLTGYLPLQLYLDMIGTAIAAIAIGPWRGAVVGYMTSVVSWLLGHGEASLLFGIAEVAGALAWGYGVRWSFGRTAPRYLGLNLFVACLATAIAAPIIVSLGGHTGHGTDALFNSIEQSGHTLWTSVVSGNLLTSLADKLISGLVALVAIASLPLAYRQRFPLAKALGTLSAKVASKA